MSDLIDRRAEINELIAMREHINTGMSIVGHTAYDDDLISRQEAIDTLTKWADGYRYIEVPTEYAVEEFKNLPSADVCPCDVCKYNPPSSMDGKPCMVCPAERRTE